MRFAFRQLAKNPGFTIVALLTLALAIGVNTTAFTVLNRLLLQSLPFRATRDLVQVWASTPNDSFAGHAPGDFFDEQEQNTVFSAMAAYIPGSGMSLSEPGQPAVEVGSVPGTANFFAVLGVEPQLGRLPSAEEERRFDPVTLVSNAFWRQHYNSDPNIIGRSVRLDAKMNTVIGVMPPSLDDPTIFNSDSGFFPLNPMRLNRELRGSGWYTVVARLKPGISVAQAQSELTVLAARFAKEHPKTNTQRTFRVIPFPNSSVGEIGTSLTWLTMALSGMVLLIACVNLANLQLVRTTRRGQEIAVRLALGCERSRVVWLLLQEALIVSVAGGALGILVAWQSTAYVSRFFDLPMPLDLRVVGFTFLASLLTGILFGTVPAWMASRPDLNSALKSGGRGASSGRSRHWLRQGLVVFELGLTLVLLAGATFFVTGIYRLTHRNLGWDPTHAILGGLQLDHETYGEQGDPRSVAFGDRLVAALRAIPGVKVASISRGSPAYGAGWEAIRAEGEPTPEPGRERYAGGASGDPDFLNTYGITLLEGRMFRESDRAGSPPVVIVNEKLAHVLWPGESALGKRVGGVDPAKPEWAEVVGVVKNYENGAEFYDRAANGMKILHPWAQKNHRFLSFTVRTAGPPDPLVETVRKTVGRLAPDFAIGDLNTVEGTLQREVSYFSFLRKVLIQIAVLGLLLSAVGIYGVVANLASERTREVGIRMALGAGARNIIWLFLGNGLKLALLGAAIGVGGAWVLVVFLGKWVPALPGRDPVAVAVIAVFLVGVALLACWIPARRTTRVDPTTALRAE